MPTALPTNVSETDTARSILAPFCNGIGLDMGFGGSSITPTALTFDMAQPYTNVGGDRQVLRGDARRLPFVCNEALDFIHSSHLLEDFHYDELVNIITEWRRCLRTGGVLVTNCPDQQKFLSHCATTGQGVNLAHKEQDFSLSNFKSRVLSRTGPWTPVFEEPNHGPYSWLLVIAKA